MNACPALLARPNDLTDDDLNAAIEDAKRYTARFCYENRRADEGQVSSGAVEGAFYAWRNYNPKIGTPWHVYLRQMIRYHVAKCLRPTQARSRAAFEERCQTIPLDSPCQTEYVGDGHLHDIIADPRSAETERVEWEAVIQCLTEREQWVIRRHYYDQMPFAEIAELLKPLDPKWNAMRVWRLEQQAVAKIKALLTSPDTTARHTAREFAWAG